jgi:hypothetical protein
MKAFLLKMFVKSPFFSDITSSQLLLFQRSIWPHAHISRAHELRISLHRVIFFRFREEKAFLGPLLSSMSCSILVISRVTSFSGRHIIPLLFNCAIGL